MPTVQQKNNAQPASQTPHAQGQAQTHGPDVALRETQALDAPKTTGAIAQAIERMQTNRAIDQRQEQQLYSSVWAGVAAALIKTPTPAVNHESRRRFEQLQHELALAEEKEKKRKRGAANDDSFVRAIASIVGPQAAESINEKISQAQKNGTATSPQQAAQLAKDIAAALKSNDALLQLHISTQSQDTSTPQESGKSQPSSNVAPQRAEQPAHATHELRGTQSNQPSAEQLDIRHPLNHPVPAIRDAIVQMAQPGVNPARGMITLPEVEPLARQLMPAAKNLGFQGTRDQFTEALYALAQRVEDGQGVTADQIRMLTEHHLTEKHGPPSPHLVAVVTDLLARVQYAKAASLNEGQVAHAILQDGEKPATVFGQVLADQVAGILEATGEFAPPAPPQPTPGGELASKSEATAVPNRPEASADLTRTVSREASTATKSEDQGVAIAAQGTPNLNPTSGSIASTHASGSSAKTVSVVETTKSLSEVVQKTGNALVAGYTTGVRTLEQQTTQALSDAKKLVARASSTLKIGGVSATPSAKTGPSQSLATSASAGVGSTTGAGVKKITAGAPSAQNLAHNPEISFPAHSTVPSFKVNSVADLTKQIKDLAHKAAHADARGDREVARALELEAKDTLSDNKEIVVKRLPQEQAVLGALFSTAKAAEDTRLEQHKKQIDSEIKILATAIAEEGGAQVANGKASHEAILKRFDAERALLTEELDPTGEIVFKAAEIAEERAIFEKQLDLKTRAVDEANCKAAEEARVAEEKAQKRADSIADFNRRAKKDLPNAIQFCPDVATEILKSAEGTALIKKHLEGLKDTAERVAFFSSLTISGGQAVASDIIASYEKNTKRSLLADIRDMAGNFEVNRAAAVRMIQESKAFEPAQVASFIHTVANEKALVMSRLEAETKRKAQEKADGARDTIEKHVQAIAAISKEHASLKLANISLKDIPYAEQPERLLQVLGEVLPELKDKTFDQAADVIRAEVKKLGQDRTYLGLTEASRKVIKLGDDPLIHLNDAFTAIKESRAELKRLESVEEKGAYGEISRMKKEIAEGYGTLPGFDAAYAQGLAAAPNHIAVLTTQAQSNDKNVSEKAQEELLQLDFAVFNARMLDALCTEDTEAGRERALIAEFSSSLANKRGTMAEALRQDIAQKIAAFNSIDELAQRLTQAAASEVYFREVHSTALRGQVEELKKLPTTKQLEKKELRLGAEADTKAGKSTVSPKQDSAVAKKKLDELRALRTDSAPIDATPEEQIVRLTSELAAHKATVASLKTQVGSTFASTKQLRRALFSGVVVSGQEREQCEALFQRQLSGDGFERAFRPHTGPTEDPHKSSRYAREDVKKGFDGAYASIAAAQSTTQKANLILPVVTTGAAFSVEVANARAVFDKKPGEGAEPHLAQLRQVSKSDTILAEAFSQIPETQTGPQQISALKNKLSFSPLRTAEENRDNATRLMRVETFVHTIGQPAILPEIGVRDGKASAQVVWDAISKKDTEELTSLVGCVRGARIEQDLIAALGLDGTKDREKLEAYRNAHGGVSLADQMLARRSLCGGSALVKRIVASPLALADDHKKLFGNTPVPQDKEARQQAYVQLSGSDQERANAVIMNAHTMLSTPGNDARSVAQRRAETALAYEFSVQAGDVAARERFAGELKKIDDEIEAKFAEFTQPLSSDARHRLGIDSILRELVDVHCDTETAKLLEPRGKLGRGVKEVAKLLAGKELTPTTDPSRPVPSMRDAAVDTIRQLNLTETQSVIFKGLYSQNLQKYVPHATQLTGSLEQDLGSGKVFASKEGIAKLIRGGKESLTEFDIQNALRGIEMGDAHQTVRSVALLKAAGLLEDGAVVAGQLGDALANKIESAAETVGKNPTFQTLAHGLGKVGDYTLDSAAYFASVSSEKVIELTSETIKGGKAIAGRSKEALVWAAKQTGADKAVNFMLDTSVVKSTTKFAADSYEAGKELTAALGSEITNGASAILDYVETYGAEGGQWLYGQIASHITPEMTKQLNEALDELSLDKLAASFNYSKGRAPKGAFAELIQHKAGPQFGESDAQAISMLMKQMEMDTTSRSAGRERSEEYRELRERVMEQKQEAGAFRYSVLDKLQRTRTQHQRICSTESGAREQYNKSSFFEADAASRVQAVTEQFKQSQLKLLKVQNSFMEEVEGGERLIERRGLEVLGAFLRDTKHLLSLDTSDKELTETKKKSLAVDWREVNETALDEFQKAYKEAIANYQAVVWRVQVAKTVATTSVLVGSSVFLSPAGAFAVSALVSVGENSWGYINGEMSGGEAVRQILINGAIDLTLARFLGRKIVDIRVAPNAQFSAFKSGVATTTSVKTTAMTNAGARLSKASPKKVTAHITPGKEKQLVEQLPEATIKQKGLIKSEKSFLEANAKEGKTVYSVTVEIVGEHRQFGRGAAAAMALGATAIKEGYKQVEQWAKKPKEKQDDISPRGTASDQKSSLGLFSSPLEKSSPPGGDPGGAAPGSAVTQPTNPSPTKPDATQLVPQTPPVVPTPAPVMQLTFMDPVALPSPTPVNPGQPPVIDIQINGFVLPLTHPLAGQSPLQVTPLNLTPQGGTDPVVVVEKPAGGPTATTSPVVANTDANTTIALPGNYGGMFDNFALGENLNTGGIFVARSDTSQGNNAAPPPPPLTPSNVTTTERPEPPRPPPPRNDGRPGPRIVVDEGAERLNTLVAEERRLKQQHAEEMRITQQQAQSDALQASFANARQNLLARNLSTTSSLRADTEQRYTVTHAHVGSTSQNTTAFQAPYGIQMSGDSVSSAYASATFSNSMAEGATAVSANPYATSQSTPVASAWGESSDGFMQSARSAPRLRDHLVAAADERESVMQMNLVDAGIPAAEKQRIPLQAQTGRVEEALEAKTRETRAVEALSVQGRAARGEKLQASETHVSLVEQPAPSSQELSVSQRSAQQGVRQSSEISTSVASEASARVEAHRHEQSEVRGASKSTDRIAEIARQTTLEQLEAAAEEINAAERSEDHEAEDVRRERRERKLKSRARLRAIILHQLMNMRFERLKKQRLLQLLISLGISEKEYRELILKIGEMEAQAMADRRRRTSAAVRNDAQPQPQGSPAPPLKPPVRLREGEREQHSPRAQQISRAELYARMKGE